MTGAGSPTVAWSLPVSDLDYDRVPASVWIRCLQLQPYLAARGVRSVIGPPAVEADVCVIVRMQDERALDIARTARARGCRVVFDLCVNYFDVSGPLDGAYGVTGRQVDECRRMLDVADVVTVASRYIEARAAEFHPRVVHLPDSVDRRHFRLDKDYPPMEDGRSLTAVWCGTAAKAPELEPFLPALASRNIPLTIVSDRRPSLSRRYRFVRWRYASAPAALLEGDFCFAPRLVDSPYNRGHTLFKIGVFLAQGVPALASPVPSYREVVLHERTGFLVESPEDWGGALDRLLAEPEVLPRWSKEAREAMRPYLTERVVDGYVDLFRALGR